jgi:predicted RNA-binding Zn-ribbon protein involved in translation (DUF1610 family)
MENRTANHICNMCGSPIYSKGKKVKMFTDTGTEYKCKSCGCNSVEYNGVLPKELAGPSQNREYLNWRKQNLHLFV